MKRILSVFAALCLSVPLFAQIGGGSLVQGFQSGASSTGGSGTVTSVGLTIGGFTVTGSPVTTSGTLAALLASPVANGIVTSTSGGSLQATTATITNSGNTLTFAGGSSLTDNGSGTVTLNVPTGQAYFFDVNAAQKAALDMNGNLTVSGGLIATSSSASAPSLRSIGNNGAIYFGSSPANFVGFAAGGSGVATIGGPAAGAAGYYMFSGLFSGGSGTSTLPYMLLQPVGATASTTWNTAGTIYGCNAPSGFTGQLMDLQLNGVSKASINSAGAVSFAGDMYVSQGSANGPGYAFNGATTTGTYCANPGIGFSVAAASVGTWTATGLNISNTTNSTTATTGALTTAGGLGVAENANIGFITTVGFNSYTYGVPTNNSASALQTNGATVTFTGTSGTTNFGDVVLKQTTYTNSSANTIINLATLSIVGAPTTSGSQIGTNKYAINVIAGAVATPAVILGTAAPTNGIGTWEFGVNRTGSALVISTTNGLQVNVGGTTYTLAVLSTNP